MSGFKMDCMSLLDLMNNEPDYDWKQEDIMAVYEKLYRGKFPTRAQLKSQYYSIDNLPPLIPINKKKKWPSTNPSVAMHHSHQCGCHVPTSNRTRLGSTSSSCTSGSYPDSESYDAVDCSSKNIENMEQMSYKKSGFKKMMEYRHLRHISRDRHHNNTLTIGEPGQVDSFYLKSIKRIPNPQFYTTTLKTSFESPIVGREESLNDITYVGSVMMSPEQVTVSSTTDNKICQQEQEGTPFHSHISQGVRYAATLSTYRQYRPGAT